MSRRSSSQVGLFSAQISEQIQRLRTLTHAADGPTEAHQVDLRRAVMATRLLAGSARILSLESLHHFLDELLAWLQQIEQSGRPLTSTQALILESIVELEESLMTHLDETKERDADLEPFRVQIEDLLQLIHRNAEHLDRGREPEKVEEPLPKPSADFDAAGLTTVVSGFCSRLASETSPELSSALVDEAKKAIEELTQTLDTLKLRAARSTPSRMTREVADLESLADPGSDPVVGPAIARLKGLADHIGFQFTVSAFGSGGEVSKSIRGTVGEVLGALVQDIASAVAAADAAAIPIHVCFEIRRELGRVRIIVSDDAPRGASAPGLGDSDHLALYTGLRRARTLLTQLHGLIRVEPADVSDVRFEFTVPEDLARPTYVVLQLDGSSVAIPASLYEGTINTGGLLYEADESGESIQHAGRSIPLLDLGQFIGLVLPSSGSTPHVVITGDVEKRLGLAIAEAPKIVRTEELGDAPAGWTALAYAGLTIGGEVVPVLDVRRLLQLRFRPIEDTGLAGAGVDPMIDAFDPIELSGPVASSQASGLVTPVRRPQTAILVNQSEFRRRELKRVLFAVGLTVLECDDLSAAAQKLQEEKLDLLVTDLRLGQDSGQSFDDLRRQHRGLRVVLTSSVAQQYAEELAGRTGADRCWLDPYRRADLEAILRDFTG